MIPALGTRTKILIAACIVVVAGTISWSLYLERSGNSKGVAAANTGGDNLIENQLTGEENAADADGDGLATWEEDLWGTSDSDSDSDNDGTGDGAEVLADRNPAKSAFEGSDEVASSTDDTYVTEETDPNSLTSRIARSVFTNVVQYASADQYTEEIGVELASQLSYAAATEAFPADVFSMADAITISNPTKEDIRNYGNNLMLVIFGEMENVYNDPTAFDDLSVSARAFRDTAVKLAEIAVPAEIAPTHVKIVNNYNATFESLEDVYYYQQDPAKALLALRSYSDIAERQPREFQLIEKYFQTNGIIFDSDDMGAVGFPNLVGIAPSTDEN
jgi:hypothetical protein